MSKDTFITDFFTAINDCVIERGFDAAICEVENMQKEAPDVTAREFAGAAVNVLKGLKARGCETIPLTYISALQDAADEQEVQGMVAV